MDEMTVIEVCQKLVRAKSYSGEEGDAVLVIESIMKALNFDEIIKDKYGNIYGIMNGAFEGPTQLFDGHVDTVVVPDEGKWQYDPFGGQLIDGKIYGRGTSDMKGALSAMLIAVAEFSHITKKQFKGKLCVAGVVHEECFEGVAAREISKNLSPDYVIIGEASSLNLKHGQRGRAEIVIETFGKPAHSANPEHGVHAVYYMSEIINVLKEIQPAIDPNLGKGILVLTDIISGPYPGSSVVPDYCKTTWDRRLLVNETKETVLKPIQEVLDKITNAVDGLEAKVSLAIGDELCYTGTTIGDERFFPGWYYEPTQAFVKDVHEALINSGIKSSLTHYDFCTNGSHYAGEAGIKTIGFGPSEEFLAHTIDEYIEVTQLETAVEGYKAIMKTLLNL